jgi:uncharacterized protein
MIVDGAPPRSRTGSRAVHRGWNPPADGGTGSMRSQRPKPIDRLRVLHPRRFTAVATRRSAWRAVRARAGPLPTPAGTNAFDRLARRWRDNHPMPAARPPAPPPPAPAPPSPPTPDAVQALLDALPAPLQPLDATMVDGYLCAVLLQPRRPGEADWLPPLLDDEGRRPPPSFDLGPLRAALRVRHAELDAAIERRDWFDPWIYEPDEAETPPGEAVLPWVLGFAAACAQFPALMALDDPALLEPLALICQHLDPDELEDADALIAEIETLEPPQDLAEAVEMLVRACLLIADVTRPAPRPSRPSGAKRPPRRGDGPPRGSSGGGRRR